MKDYYAILGVLPSIDQVALTAVYRALLKKYHPDVFAGSADDAHRITKELNEAYEVLGDPRKRAAYDRARTDENANSGDYGSQSADEARRAHGVDEAVERGWAFVVRYHPGAEKERLALAKISPNLAFQFQIVLLEGKNAQAFESIAKKLKVEFLKRYFGADEDVHEFVLSALEEGRKDVALEVNRAIKVLGSPSGVNVPEFLRQVSQKCGWLSPMARAEMRRVQNRSSLQKFPGLAEGAIVLLVVTVLYIGYTSPNSSTPAPTAPIQTPPLIGTPSTPAPTAALTKSAPEPTNVLAPQPIQPSFDCGKISSSVLKLVCSTPELAGLDNQLSNAYAEAMSKLPSPVTLRNDERAWITARNNGPADVTILKQLYADRISVLQTIAANPSEYIGAAIPNINEALVFGAAEKVNAALKEGGTIKVGMDLDACYEAATPDNWTDCLAYDAVAEYLLPTIEKTAGFPPTEMFVASTYRTRAKEHLDAHGITNSIEQEEVLQLLNQLSVSALEKVVLHRGTRTTP